MSKVTKFVRKVFKKVVHLVKEIVIPLVVVAAVIWTAGAALGAFASAGSVLASVGGALQAAGGWVLAGLKAAATGIFTMVAKGISAATTFAKGALGISSTAAPVVAPSVVTPVATGSAVGAGAGAGGSKALAALKALSTTDKLLLGSAVASTAGGLMAPDAEDIAKAEAKYRGHQGAFYGMNADGTVGNLFSGARVTPAEVNPVDLFRTEVDRPAPIGTPLKVGGTSPAALLAGDLFEGYQDAA